MLTLTCRRALVLPIVILTLTATSHSGPQDELDYVAVLAQIYPDSKVNFDPETKAGTLDYRGRPHSFEIQEPSSITIGNEHYTVFVLTYRREREAAFEEFVESGEHKKADVSELLVCASHGDVSQTAWRPIDSEAVSIHPRSIEIRDLLGDGTLQVNLQTTNSYFLTDPNEIIQARQFYVFSLPGLEEVLAVTKLKIIASETTKEIVDAQEVRFTGDVSDGTRRVELYRPDGKLIQTVPLVDGRFDYVSAPVTKRDEKAMAKRHLVPKELRILVVDGQGAPLEGVRINGRVSWVRSYDWAEKHEPFQGVTDDRGFFEVSSRGAVGMSLYKEGYYDVRKHWPREAIPDERVTIVLEEEHERVRMDVGTVEFTYETDADRYVFGIKFVEETAASRNGAATDIREDSDLWVELYRTGETFIEGEDSIIAHNNETWHARITGQNGWRLHPESDKTSKMREAPEGTYTQIVDGSFANIPKRIYLELNDGERYGRLTMNIRDGSRFGKVSRRCGISYNVQAEATGTRSLNRR